LSNKKTIVVTSIIENDNKILILKRSEIVKSFKNKWGGISGYFEKNEDLLSRALVEIYEETKINKQDIILRKILGQKIIQIETGKVIIIQPFYFSSKTKKISLNWEHTEYMWITKDQKNKYDTVPKLGEMLCQCFLINNK
jgi:8-oxo-dGTP diphosphatase